MSISQEPQFQRLANIAAAHEKHRITGCHYCLCDECNAYRRLLVIKGKEDGIVQYRLEELVG